MRFWLSMMVVPELDLTNGQGVFEQRAGAGEVTPLGLGPGLRMRRGQGVGRVARRSVPGRRGR